jgi:serine/threonine protein kinase/tetratricopeptide (TPR) repeat protein
MPVAAAKSTTCTKCGAEVDTTTSADLGCMVCLLKLGFDRATERDSPLDEFGHYVIEKREDGRAWELGRGAMGVTYLATDSVLQRHVALKIINLACSRNVAVVRERFLREARAAATLRHPNIATVYEFGIREESGQCFYAMELVEGETLEERVRRTGPCDVRTIIEVARQVADALAEAEKRGLVHRDIKPANLMVIEGGDPADFTIKVIDFGVAKALAQTTDTRTLTHAGFIGTPAFASPEQWTNSAVDVRSDIYSLGATLCYLLTGQVPFRDNQRGPPPVEQLRTANVPSRLIALLCAMLASEPAARPGLRDLAAKLQPLQTGDRKKAMRWIAIAAAGVLLVAVTLALFRREAAVDNQLPEKSIAVLPFDSFGNDKDNIYFADAIQDDVLTNLAKIADLKVISRTSVMQYRGSAKNARQIGEELKVGHLLEATVRKSSGRVRVNAQLIDTQNDAHLWTETYDRDIADVRTIEGEIGTAIAAQLEARVLPRERAAMSKASTTDVTANKLYQQAKQLEASGVYDDFKRQDLLEAARLLDEAVARDPGFLLAYCLLSRTQILIYFYGLDHTPARRELSYAALQQAARLHPDVGEVHLALAEYAYHAFRDYDRARAELAAARPLLPNNADVDFMTGAIDRRQGRWEGARQHLDRAVELDPRNLRFLGDAAELYQGLRRYRDAIRLNERILEIAPHDYFTQMPIAQMRTDEAGDFRPLRTKLSAILAEEPTASGRIAPGLYYCALFERDAAATARAIAAIPPDGLPVVDFSFPREWYVGLAARSFGDTVGANAAFSAGHALTEKLVRSQPDYAPAWSLLGMIDAGLGRKEEAMREGRRACELLPLARDAWIAPGLISNLALIYAWTGENDLALEQLAISARIPNGVTYGDLKLNPQWDSLRGDPRFEKIVASLAPNAPR